jgi:ABC-2 type transport system permease protein
VSETTVSTVRPPIRIIFGSLFRADFTVLLKSGRTMIINVAVPIFILIITNLGHSKLSFGDVGFEIGLALTYGLIASSLIGYSITVARDRDAGVFQRLRVTPAPTWTIMTSRLLVQVILNLVLTVVVVVIGSIIHHVTFTVAQYLLMVVVSLVGGAVFLSIGQAVVALIRSAAVVNAVGRLLYIVLILVGILGVSGLLGTTFQTISQWSPVGAVIDLFTGVLDLSHWNGVDTNAVIACAAYIVVGSFIGIRWFHWDAH